MPCIYTFGAAHRRTDMNKSIRSGGSKLNLGKATLPLNFSRSVRCQILPKSNPDLSLLHCTYTVASVAIIAFKNWSYYGHSH
jgi:hypothetical protein